MTLELEPKHIVVVDPRQMDGNPFDVAGRAAEQVRALVELSGSQAEIAAIMHRNSLQEAILQDKRDLSPTDWSDSAYSRMWEEVIESLDELARKVTALGRAAGFDPKHPPKA